MKTNTASPSLNPLGKLALIALSGVMAMLVHPASAQIVMDEGHVDLDFDYIGGEWVITVNHDDFPAVAPGDALLHARDDAWPSGSRLERPPGDNWNFVGVGAGESFWHFPQTQQSGILWPGFAAENTPHGTLAAYSELDPRVTDTAARWISISLEEVRFTGEGDGHVSLWTTGAFGDQNVFWSTFDEPEHGNIWYQLEGGHSHMNWAFSDPGLYELDLRASAFLNDGEMTLVESDIVTFEFGIGVIPEPKTYTLLAGLAAYAAILVIRRKRNTHPYQKS